MNIRSLTLGWMLALLSGLASHAYADTCEVPDSEAWRQICAPPEIDIAAIDKSAAEYVTKKEESKKQGGKEPPVPGADVERRLSACLQCAKEALEKIRKLPASAKQVEDEAIADALAQQTAGRHEAAKLVYDYTKLIARIEGARKQLTRSEDKREKASDKAKDNEVKDAKAEMDKADDSTEKARDTLNEIDVALSSLGKRLAGEQGTHEARKAWLSELQQQITSAQAAPGAAPAAPDPQTAERLARLNSYRRKIEAQQAASVELQGVLQTLTTALAEQKNALQKEVEASEELNEELNDKALKQIALKNGDRVSYGVTLAAVRLRATRDPDQDARIRDYQPEAEFVPTLLGLRIVYDPSDSPWRLETAGDPLQLIGIEFPLYLEKGDGNSLESLSAGVGLTLVDGLLGIGLAFDVYRVVKVKGGQTETGIMPWTLSRTGEVTAENVSVMLTIGLTPIVEALSGSVDAEGEDAP